MDLFGFSTSYVYGQSLNSTSLVCADLSCICGPKTPCPKFLPSETPIVDLTDQVGHSTNHDAGLKDLEIAEQDFNNRVIVEEQRLPSDDSDDSGADANTHLIDVNVKLPFDIRFDVAIDHSHENLNVLPKYDLGRIVSSSSSRQFRASQTGCSADKPGLTAIAVMDHYGNLSKDTK